MPDNNITLNAVDRTIEDLSNFISKNSKNAFTISETVALTKALAELVSARGKNQITNIGG